MKNLPVARFRGRGKAVVFFVKQLHESWEVRTAVYCACTEACGRSLPSAYLSFSLCGKGQAIFVIFVTWKKGNVLIIFLVYSWMNNESQIYYQTWYKWQWGMLEICFGNSWAHLQVSLGHLCVVLLRGSLNVFGFIGGIDKCLINKYRGYLWTSSLCWFFLRWGLTV